MICSNNEIGATLRKAAVGSGYPAGLADNISAAGVWLSAHGHGGVRAALDALAANFDQPFSPDPTGDRVLRIAPARVGRCGISLFELLVAGEIDTVVLESVDAPTLLVGFAGVVAGTADCTFAITDSVGVRHVVSGAAVGVSEVGVSEVGQEIPRQIEIVRIDDTGASAGAPEVEAHADLPAGIDVDEDAWNEALQLAAKTYVPATLESRIKGAGAGLTDND
ncbi:MAG: DUF3726 domain-containing protein [Acidimicrobiales bacterium]|jgi:hypothetical protein